MVPARGLTFEGLPLEGMALHRGVAEGDLLVLDQPLSFWGGTDRGGRITDEHHPQHGRSLTGRVVAMPAGRGSSSSSSVLAEAIRSGAAPAALLLAEPDGIIVLAAIVAAELYDKHLPIVVLDHYAALPTSGRARVDASQARAMVQVDQ